MPCNNKNTVTVIDTETQKGHRIAKKILELDRTNNKGISKGVQNSTVAKRLIVAGMSEGGN